MRSAQFNLKLGKGAFYERLHQVYDDDERFRLFNGLPIDLAKGDQTISAEISAFWLNEAMLYSPNGAHPLATLHPRLDQFVQTSYREEKRFRDLPESIMQRVSTEDNKLYPLAGGWVVISDGTKILGTARLQYADYERGLETILPLHSDIWTLPLEKIRSETGETFLSPEHRQLHEEGLKLFPRMQAEFAAAKSKAAHDEVFAKYATLFKRLHEKYQVAEAGRFAKDSDLRDVDILPQTLFGLWRLMRQKGIKKLYFDAITKVHARMYEGRLYREWDEKGVVQEFHDKNGNTTTWIFGLSESQIVRFLKKNILLLSPSQRELVTQAAPLSNAL